MKFWLSFIFSSLVSVPLTFADPGPATPIVIASCQHLLMGQREHLAWIEMDKFKNLRCRYPDAVRYTLGLLLAVYESRLDDEPVGIGEARSFIPANAKVAQAWIDRAADRGLVTMGFGRTNRKFRIVEAGPALSDLVNARIDAHLANLFEDARALLPERRRELSHPPTIRSEKLDRLLMSQMWSDYARAWGLNADDPSSLVRTGYGLLVHLYHLKLHGRRPSRVEILPRVPGSTIDARHRFLRALADQGFIEEIYTTANQLTLCPTTATIDLIERRMNANIDRMNRVLREATAWGPIRTKTPAASNQTELSEVD